MMRKINGKYKWTHGNTRKGVSDIHTCIRGFHVSIEIKIGKDKMNQDQIKEKAGGLYFVANDFESFLNWYNHWFK